MLTQKYYESDLKLKTKANDVQLNPKLICGLIMWANSKMIWSNFTLFSFLRQKPINVFLNDLFFLFFFYAIDMFWIVTERNNKKTLCCKFNEKKKLDTKKFFCGNNKKQKF
jgi:hypothetical protein